MKAKNPPIGYLSLVIKDMNKSKILPRFWDPVDGLMTSFDSLFLFNGSNSLCTFRFVFILLPFVCGGNLPAVASANVLDSSIL